ncbi:MAG: ABC transporter permease [Acidimicrobiales bacterium]
MTDIAADRIPGGPEVWRAHAEGHRVEQEIDESEGPISARRRFARRFFRQRAAVVGLAFLVLLVIVAVIGPWLAPYGENELTGKLLSGPTAQHWLGTDESGRDTFSRLIFATRIALSAAFSAVGIAVALGVIPGLLAGLLGRWVDYTVMRVVEAFLAFPPLLLALAINGAMGPGLRNAMLAIGIVYAPRFTRMVRGAVLAVKEETFIEAARSMGCSTGKILTAHVLPNILSPLVVQISLSLGFTLLAEAALSFLGLGVVPPEASWGTMLSRAYLKFFQQPFLAIPPGMMILLTVLAFNVVGDGIRDSFGREIRRS